MVHAEKRKAAIYCRVSSPDQNCDRQRHDLLDYVSKLGYDVAGTWQEVASGTRSDRKERQKVLALAQARKIDVILVTELTRWGRSTLDLLQTLQQLEVWKVSLIAQTGFQFNLSTPHGKLMAGLLAVLAEFERDLTRERIQSGLALARARGKRLGRQRGYCPKSDPLESRVVQMSREGTSYRAIALELNISKTTVNGIIQRYRQRLIEH